MDDYDGPPFERETETGLGMPLFEGAQTALACARLSDDVDGEVVQETLILPNLVCFFTVFVGGVRLGQSVITSPQFARQFAVTGLPERAAEITDCDCESHDGRSMLMLDLRDDLYPL